MGKQIAETLSIVFQPLLIPLYSVFLLFNTDTYITYALSTELQHFIYGVVVVNSMLLPMAVFFFLLSRGHIQSLQMHTAQERSLPFLTVVIFQLSTYVLFDQMPIPALIPDLVLGGALSVLMAFVVNLRWKISIHMLGMGGLVGTFIGLAMRYQVDALYLVIALLLLSGLVGYARLRLNAHTPAQVYVGFLSGALLLVGVVCGS
jgi:membrane-associated phospholipid phosphatase